MIENIEHIWYILKEWLNDMITDGVLPPCWMAYPLNIGSSHLSSEFGFWHIHNWEREEGRNSEWEGETNVATAIDDKFAAERGIKIETLLDIIGLNPRI